MIIKVFGRGSSAVVPKYTNPPLWFNPSGDPCMVGNIFKDTDEQAIKFGLGNTMCPKDSLCFRCPENTTCAYKSIRQVVTISRDDAQGARETNPIWNIKWHGSQFDPKRCPTSVKLTTKQLMGAFGIIDHVEGDTTYFRDRMGASSGHLQHYSRAGNFLAFPGPNFSEAPQYWLYLEIDPRIKNMVQILCKPFA